MRKSRGQRRVGMKIEGLLEGKCLYVLLEERYDDNVEHEKSIDGYIAETMRCSYASVTFEQPPVIVPKLHKVAMTLLW